MTRIAAHRITFMGRTYDMHVLEFTDNGAFIRAFPLEKEIHSTRFYSGCVKVMATGGNITVKPVNG